MAFSVSRAITFLPITAWMGTSNICRGITRSVRDSEQLNILYYNECRIAHGVYWPTADQWYPGQIDERLGQGRRQVFRSKRTSSEEIWLAKQTMNWERYNFRKIATPITCIFIAICCKQGTDDWLTGTYSKLANPELRFFSWSKKSVTISLSGRIQFSIILAELLVPESR